ncbi:hypothetical protein M0802_001568 [Mischocyttarus mexicanus]|nr:hypothetical protein M0802_001568 [Mischocyttarus mexicanus]
MEKKWLFYLRNTYFVKFQHRQGRSKNVFYSVYHAAGGDKKKTKKKKTPKKRFEESFEKKKKKTKRFKPQIVTSLTLTRRSLRVHTLLAKSLEAPRMRVPVESKSTDITPALLPTSTPLHSDVPETKVSYRGHTSHSPSRETQTVSPFTLAN